MVTYYEKRGNRYYPILEKELWSSGDTWSEGCHLVVCKPGCRTVRYKVQPDDSAFLAAQTIHAEVLASMLVKAWSAKSDPPPLTQEQQDAWKAFQKTFDGGPYGITFESAVDVAKKFLNHLREFQEGEKIDDKSS